MCDEASINQDPRLPVAAVAAAVAWSSLVLLTVLPQSSGARSDVEFLKNYNVDLIPTLHIYCISTVCHVGISKDTSAFDR